MKSPSFAGISDDLSLGNAQIILLKINFNAVTLLTLLFSLYNS